MSKKPKKPKVTDAEKLASMCPKCGAIAGEKCHDYRGKGKAFCVERGRPEVTAKKLAKKAAEINKKIGPDAQFPGLLAFTPEFEEFRTEFKPVTPADLEAKKLRDLRNGVAESGGTAETGIREALNWITIRYLRRVAAELIGAKWEGKIWARCVDVFGNKLDYIANQYARCLCTTEILDLAYARYEDQVPPTQWNPRGIRIRVEATEKWPPAGYTPVMTREDFRERFELRHIFWKAPTDMPEPDDCGLFERTIGRLAGKLG